MSKVVVTGGAGFIGSNLCEALVQKGYVVVAYDNFYAASKLANEHLAMLFASQYSIRITGLRYMSVYGPHEKTKGIYANLVSQFLWDMQKDKAPVIYGNGKQTRDFTYVKDVAKANILAMESGIKSDIFNVGTGISHSLVDLIRILNKILGFKAQYSLEQGIREILTT